MLELNKIYNESCLDTLARMPDESIDCVVTSPPYYGLRSYGTEPQVWGNHNGCAHTWGGDLPALTKNFNNGKGGIFEGRADKLEQGAEINHRSSGNFCLDCNAWRGELGLEPTFQLYISHLIDIFREVKRVLKPTGTCWVNLGDSYSGSWGNYVAPGSESAKALDKRRKDRYGTFKPAAADRNGAMGVQPKSLMNIPARFAIAMTDELGFIQRNEIIWHKPACMPSSAKDRFTVDFEPIFFFTKSPRYWFERQLDVVSSLPRERERPNGQPTFYSASGTSCGSTETRNMRTVWRVNFEPQSEEHYASYPTKLVEIPIKAGCPEGGIVYDPFIGTATTAIVAHKLGRKWIGSELNPEYVEIAMRRLEPILAQSTLFDG